MLIREIRGLNLFPHAHLPLHSTINNQQSTINNRQSTLRSFSGEGFAKFVVNSSSFKARIQFAYPRISRQVCHVKTLPDDHHFFREGRTLRWQRIAGLVDANPKKLDIALENIQRWLDLGRVHPAPLLDWKQRIHDARQCPQAYAEFDAFLAAPNHNSFPIKSCSPFVGLEPASEKR